MTEQMNGYGFYDPQKDEDLPVFKKVSLDIPVPEKREILVEVKAVGLNPTDLATRMMKKSSDDSFTILGRDVSGTVVQVGEDVELFKTGDDVFYPGTSKVQGAQADYHLIDERMVALKPKNLTYTEAAALPLTSLTSYEVMHDRLDLFSLSEDPSAVTLLIVGAAGGVGSVACQIALNYGFTVIGTASREESRKYVKELGVEHIIDHTEPFGRQLEELGFDNVDTVFVAAKADENIGEISKVIAPQGRVCSLLPLQKPLPGRFFGKSVTFSYELMYTRSVYETSDWIKQHEYLTELKNQVEQGFITSNLETLYSEMNEDTLRKAYAQLQTEHTIGKIVLAHDS
ncbi:zinc-binding alcohol dehydrogenase family protein [Alkalibacterium subtropicum]|uniref:Zinc-type alcohol dehydrogenase-like protein n=1 Tax=Alkalibacterium subtropicum TaxID=753702 RepID=A0A1I1KH53_9LACT|nr:zinc-binding alcohol dehydrogenase family protein [Alkalibacterium subtropicum]SFC58028.1 zinc-binding alcohol dehydrogenase family protein [Alkalibacterium subtropicum]